MKKNTGFDKPQSIIYNSAAALVRAYLFFKLHPVYNTSEIRKIKGPALVMCSHTSNLDFLLLGVAALPQRPTYIMSSHFFAHPKISKLLGPLNAIPKKMFCADINAVRQIMKAVKAGNVVVMFPEGRLSCSGHSVQIADGTAELVKKLGVDVYYFTENGLYKALPKWGHAGIRKGPVSVEGGLLWTKEELSEMSVSDIKEGLSEALYHDDEAAFEGKRYKCKSPALGLDGILYKCPICGEEFKTESSDNELKCTACGASWTLDEYYVLHANDTNRYISSNVNRDSSSDENGTASDNASVQERLTSINEWFDWEQDEIDLDAGLETECLLATPGKDGILDRNAGKGTISINRENIHYEGSLWGEPFEFTEKTSVIKAFPISVGDHFDIYSNRVMYNIIPQPDPRVCVKWTQYLDKLEAEE